MNLSPLNFMLIEFRFMVELIKTILHMLEVDFEY